MVRSALTQCLKQDISAGPFHPDTEPEHEDFTEVFRCCTAASKHDHEIVHHGQNAPVKIH